MRILRYALKTLLASTLGLTIEEKRSSEPVTFNEWLHVQAFHDGEKVTSAGGTFFGSPDNPRIVREKLDGEYATSDRLAGH